MEMFKKLTGIAYDRVMIFPHGVSPAPTFRALKTYGFVGTVNAINVPLFQPSPADVPLRSTALYENFPSTMRYSAEYSVSEYPHEFSVPRETIAVNAFLGNPILMYGHQGMFAKSIGAFNETADFINSIDTAIKWRSLGQILERSYLQKARLGEKNAYDVLTSSSTTCLENTDGQEKRFYVRKQEDGRPAIRNVRAGGQTHPFEIVDGYMSTSVALAGGHTVCLAIEYMDDNGEPVKLSKSSIRVRILRTVSDWRDQYLSRFSLGRSIIKAYYRDDSTKDKAAISIVAAGCAGGIVYWWRLRRRLTKNESAS
jgi:hypothetical protein